MTARFSISKSSDRSYVIDLNFLTYISDLFSNNFDSWTLKINFSDNSAVSITNFTTENQNLLMLSRATSSIEIVGSGYKNDNLESAIVFINKIRSNISYSVTGQNEKVIVFDSNINRILDVASAGTISRFINSKPGDFLIISIILTMSLASAFLLFRDIKVIFESTNNIITFGGYCLVVSYIFSSLVGKLIRKLYPNIIFNFGAGKKSYDKILLARKFIFVTAGFGVILGLFVNFLSKKMGL